MHQNEQDATNRHRRSLRLTGYDYSGLGAYFVTICTWRRECLFGNVYEGEVLLNQLGLIVRAEWSRTAQLRDNVELEACVVMPNHVHGIIEITTHRRGVLHTPRDSAHIAQRLLQNCKDDLALGALPYAPEETLRSPAETIGAIVRGFKSACTRRINQVRANQTKPIWQRNYHEHVVRDENDLQRLRQYILDNPGRWIDDRNHPSRVNKLGRASSMDPGIGLLFLCGVYAIRPANRRPWAYAIRPYVTAADGARTEWRGPGQRTDDGAHSPTRAYAIRPYATELT